MSGPPGSPLGRRLMLVENALSTTAGETTRRPRMLKDPPALLAVKGGNARTLRTRRSVVPLGGFDETQPVVRPISVCRAGRDINRRA